MIANLAGRKHWLTSGEELSSVDPKKKNFIPRLDLWLWIVVTISCDNFIFNLLYTDKKTKKNKTQPFDEHGLTVHNPYLFYFKYVQYSYTHMTQCCTQWSNICTVSKKKEKSPLCFVLSLRQSWSDEWWV